ncbi:MAG: mannan endo-1,4-beta-mannosidase A and B [Clostridia bacterium]|nr:mannan endo-1,4-beta-mannosidase A and B [Clostridia bacterium]
MNTALCNKNALPCAQRLYTRLQEVYGSRILTAQQEFPGAGRYDQEMAYIRKITGKLPAIRGTDFMHDDYRGAVERSIAWHNQGGIVHICWHTGLVGLGYTECLEEKPDFEALFTEGSEARTLLLRRWNDAADALMQLQNADIPVLWRPFHEFNGGWFWWGKGGSEAFIRLWREMYAYFTEVRGLNNLIWVLGYADEVAPDWYPGDAYCDIAGSDTYRSVTTHAASFHALKRLCPEKMLAFHECGVMPEVDAFFEDGAVWLFMMPWHGKWIIEDNPPERLQRIYSDPRILTLDDVKRWR